MVRVIGIDPGSKSYDFCGLDGDHLFIDSTIDTEKIVKDPKIVIELLKSVTPLDLIVGPSGYGLPLIHIDEIDDRKLLLMALVKFDDIKTSAVLGLRKVVAMLKKEGFNVYFIPGVIHMPTVPMYRKVNKIDMGTADKLCCSVLGVLDQSKHCNIKYNETSFVIVEVGFGYNAIIGVEKGQIVDGIGGTTGSIGFLSIGSMDSELAYLLNISDKNILRKGGVTCIVGNTKVTPKEFAKKALDNSRYNLAWEAFMEGIEKGVAQMKMSVKTPREILLSGRLCKVKRIHDELFKRLSDLGNVRKIKGFAQVSKEAAQGAAILANGLAGG
ncbi:MAG: DUF1464 family protein, partial [Candidatus Methylarchaceae archaeon HK02M2]|nr:DUF1464 family protein [Candidatus Methylarchaceae archaeon HK02M2]